MQIKTQLNWDQNCIFAEVNELDVKSAMFDMAEFWVLDFESIRHNLDHFACILYIHKSSRGNAKVELDTNTKKS